MPPEETNELANVKPEVTFDDFKKLDIRIGTVEKVEEYSKRLMNIGEDAFSYEKRICLLKTSDSVKSKAMEKLKEINEIEDIENELNEFIDDSPIHISFDVDVLDPEFMQCTGTREPGGLSLELLLNIFNILKKHNLNSMDIVEFNHMQGKNREESTNLRKRSKLSRKSKKNQPTWNQWKENPFIGNVNPPSGPWKLNTTIVKVGPYKKITNAMKKVQQK